MASKIFITSTTNKKIITMIEMLLKNVIKKGITSLNLKQTIYDQFRLHGPSAAEVMSDVDLRGKTCLVTGASSGLGLEMTRQLCARHCDVLMACRNTYAAKAASRGIADQHDSRRHIYPLNLASLASVKKCSESVIRDVKKLDMVILNAGVFGLPWTLTVDGLESTFQVNFLAQFHLLMRLEPLLAPDARVVFVTSEAHRYVSWSQTEQLAPTASLLSLPKHRYTAVKAYNTSKLCGVFALHCLGTRWLGTRRGVFAAHPASYADTSLYLNWRTYERIMKIIHPIPKNIQQAAATPLWCASSPSLAGVSGLYVSGRRRRAESELAANLRLAYRVIQLCEMIVRERAARAPAPLDDVCYREGAGGDEDAAAGVNVALTATSTGCLV